MLNCLCKRKIGLIKNKSAVMALGRTPEYFAYRSAVGQTEAKHVSY